MLPSNMFKSVNAEAIFFLGVVAVGGVLAGSPGAETLGLRKLQDSLRSKSKPIFSPPPLVSLLPAAHTRVPSTELAACLCGMHSGNLRTHSHGQ